MAFPGVWSRIVTLSSSAGSSKSYFSSVEPSYTWVLRITHKVMDKQRSWISWSSSTFALLFITDQALGENYCCGWNGLITHHGMQVLVPHHMKSPLVGNHLIFQNTSPGFRRWMPLTICWSTTRRHSVPSVRNFSRHRLSWSNMLTPNVGRSNTSPGTGLCSSWDHTNKCLPSISRYPQANCPNDSMDPSRFSNELARLPIAYNFPREHAFTRCSTVRYWNNLGGCRSQSNLLNYRTIWFMLNLSYPHWQFSIFATIHQGIVLTGRSWFNGRVSLPMRRLGKIGRNYAKTITLRIRWFRKGRRMIEKQRCKE